MPGIFDGLISMQEKDSLEQILNSMLNPENIEMKTEIQRPTNLTKLKILSIWLRNEGMINCANMIDAFIYEFRVNMVSNKRQSRKEIISALTPNLQPERSIEDKLIKQTEK